MTQELAEQIVCLALETDRQYIGDVSIKNVPMAIDRYTDSKDVLFTITIYDEYNTTPIYQMMILKNGDVHARTCPYYDGDRQGMLMIRNQIKIQELLAPIIHANN